MIVRVPLRIVSGSEERNIADDSTKFKIQNESVGHHTFSVLYLQSYFDASVELDVTIITLIGHDPIICNISSQEFELMLDRAFNEFTGEMVPELLQWKIFIEKRCNGRDRLEDNSSEDLRVPKKRKDSDEGSNEEDSDTEDTLF